MRLSDVLSKPTNETFAQVEGFLNNKNLGVGKQRKIAVGKVALNFFCKNCSDDRTFCSCDELFCIGVNNQTISIDCVLKCSVCSASVQVWFLVESAELMSLAAPWVRIAKRSEKLSDMVLSSREKYGDFSELLEKAHRAYRDELGAGSIVYLRTILERITIQVAEVAGINLHRTNGRKKPFKNLLTEVDQNRSIVPQEFSANGYRLFSELSEVVHGNYEEQIGLQKFEAFCRLVVGVLDNVRNNSELMAAIGELGWDDEKGQSG